MRFAIVVISILFLWMNAIPCADAALGKSETTISATETGGDLHDDACSPFCNCSCCSNFSIPVYQTFESITKIALSNYSLNSSDKLFEISLPIWQPPQLG